MKKETKDIVIEYSVIRAILRIGTILFLLFGAYNIFQYNAQENESIYNISSFEKNNQKILRDKFILESVNSKIKVEGNIELNINESKIKITKFKITNRDSIELIFSSENKPKNIIPIGNLKTNVGNIEFQLPINNFENHHYILFWDKNKKEVLAQIDLKN